MERAPEPEEGEVGRRELEETALQESHGQGVAVRRHEDASCEFGP